MNLTTKITTKCADCNKQFISSSTRQSELRKRLHAKKCIGDKSWDIEDKIVVKNYNANGVKTQSIREITASL